MDTVTNVSTDEQCINCDFVYSHMYLDEDEQKAYRIYMCNVFNHLDVARKVECKHVNISKHYVKDMTVYSISEVN